MTLIKNKLLKTGTVFVFFAVFLVGCGSGQGQLQIQMADVTPGTSALINGAQPPPAGTASPLITFSSVSVHASAQGGDAGWIDVMDASGTEAERTFDLGALTEGDFYVLGLETLDAGSYQMVRVIIENAVVVLDGTTYPVTVASGAQTGLKLNHPFTISESGETRLTLDFDVTLSLREDPPGSGSYTLNPVIGLIEQ